MILYNEQIADVYRSLGLPCVEITQVCPWSGGTAVLLGWYIPIHLEPEQQAALETLLRELNLYEDYLNVFSYQSVVNQSTYGTYTTAIYITNISEPTGSE